MTTLDPFANLGNAPMPGSNGPRYRHGNYTMETNLLVCKESKKVPSNPYLYVLWEATVVEVHEPNYENSNKVGERVSKAFMFQAPGWEGVYATGAMKQCIAAMLGVDFEQIEGSHALTMTGSRMVDGVFVMGPGTDAAGTLVHVVAVDSDKIDKKGNPYQDLTFAPVE